MMTGYKVLGQGTTTLGGARVNTLFGLPVGQPAAKTARFAGFRPARRQALCFHLHGAPGDLCALCRNLPERFALGALDEVKPNSPVNIGQMNVGQK